MTHVVLICVLDNKNNTASYYENYDLDTVATPVDAMRLK